VNSRRIVVRPYLNRTLVDKLAREVIKACDCRKEPGGTATPPALHGHANHAPKC
jgi:glutamate decarboxylase